MDDLVNRRSDDLVKMNVAICEALGLDPSVLSGATIELRKDDFPLVTTRSRLLGPEALTQEMARYVLVPDAACPHCGENRGEAKSLNGE